MQRVAFLREFFIYDSIADFVKIRSFLSSFAEFGFSRADGLKFYRAIQNFFRVSFK